MKQLTAAMLLLAGFAQAAEPAAELAKPLEPLQVLVGKTWKGRFKKSTEDKPLYDVMRWERALNGQAIRILHSVNDGVYGGETLIMWNPKTSRLESHYFTTAGFITHGTVTVEAGKILTREEVAGNPTGVTEVKATTEILPDGQLHVKSRYLKDGQWTEGHEVAYKESPASEVKFK